MTCVFQAICLGEGWVAVGTDKRMVRLFTVGGVQRETISVPGPIVTLAAHSNQLLIIYHSGMGMLCSIS
jgi:chromosome transmission fidelity protein 4